MFELVPFPQHGVGNETSQLMGAILKPPLKKRGRRKKITYLYWLHLSEYWKIIHGIWNSGAISWERSPKNKAWFEEISPKKTQKHTSPKCIIWFLNFTFLTLLVSPKMHVSSVYFQIRSQPPPSSPNSASERHSVALGTKTKGRKPWELNISWNLGKYVVDGWNPANHQGWGNLSHYL